MTPEELSVLYDLFGAETVYDARLNGYHITIPVKIAKSPKGDRYIIQREESDYFFSSSEIIDVKKT